MESKMEMCLTMQKNENAFNEFLPSAENSFENKDGRITEVRDIILALEDKKTSDYSIMC